MNSNLKIVQSMLTSMLLLTSLWGASNALADEAAPSEKVKFADLSVNTPEGAKTLFGRIHAAAERVCADSDPVMRGSEGPCARKAEADAVGKLNLPQLTAYYQKRTTGRDHVQLVASR